MERTKWTRLIEGNGAVKELEHRKISQKAASEGMVLLKNEGLLPLNKSSKIALYGSGASKTIKGGTGSGDVNVRENISIYQGLKEAGYEITTKKWIEDYDKLYEEGRLKWRDTIWKKADEEESMFGLFDAYSKTPFILPAGHTPDKTEADTAIYVLSRIAGEGADRSYAKGDYLLTDDEDQLLTTICNLYTQVLVIVNTGGIVDLSFVDRLPQIKGLLYISQPGMNGGYAVADILSAEETPSGKLTDTIALDYMDYPNSRTFSHNNKDTDHEYYNEGIYVGYRYFDSFFVPCRYGFGFGLSYTSFDIGVESMVLDKKETKTHLEINVIVTNTGHEFSGKEVVQVYASCPQDKQIKEYRRLIGFAKTKELEPGQSEKLTIHVYLSDLLSFNEDISGYELEKGLYGLFVGNSLMDSELFGTIDLDEDVLLKKTQHMCTPLKEIKEIQPDQAQIKAARKKWIGKSHELMQVKLKADDLRTQKVQVTYQNKVENSKYKTLVDSLDVDECISLVTGELTDVSGGNLGASSVSVPGAAAQTSAIAHSKGIKPLVLADGPAGLRLMKTFYAKGDHMTAQPFEMAMEDGFLSRSQPDTEGEEYHQYCTAMPVGTLLAQTWNLELVSQVGQAVAEEMNYFQVHLWLAPGMNIHRNPLCGRNFEYYAEDPFLTGHIAAAMVNGVQEKEACGATIKHFACNNQEDNRMGSDSILTERTLREIYLKGFEIAIEESNPLSIMTSYNKVNGIHAANSKDLCTHVARDEWGFKGVIMTDWTTTMHGEDCTASGCMIAGNDLVMPGAPMDHENMRQELKEKSLKLDDIKRSVTHLIEVMDRLGQLKVD